MNVIIPIARTSRGQAAHPLTEIAGKPLIGHLIDQVVALKPKRIVFILGEENKTLITYITKHCAIEMRFIKQRKQKGSAHAIYGAKHLVDGPVLILFSDTFFEANLKNLDKNNPDGVIWVKEVDDPREFGVVFKDGDVASRLIEKPDSPVSYLAMIGLYYVRSAKVLFEKIAFLLDNHIMTKGLYHLTDALQLMINDENKFLTREATRWYDSDGVDGLFGVHHWLIEQHPAMLGKSQNSVIIKPSYIGKNAEIKDSIIGPYASIGDGAIISESIVRDSIVGPHAVIKQGRLSQSVVGLSTTIRGATRQIIVGDGDNLVQE